MAGPEAREARVGEAMPAIANLTGRQHDVFRLLAEGCATKTIARRLDLAVGTVKVHLAAIYRQLGVRGRLEALARVHACTSGNSEFGVLAEQGVRVS